MIKQNQRILNIINLLSDGLLTFLAYFASIMVRFDLLDGTWTVNLRSAKYVYLIAVYCIAQMILFYMMRVYLPQRYTRASREIMTILVANAVCLLILIAGLYVMRQPDVSRIMIALFYVISCVLIIGKCKPDSIFCLTCHFEFHISCKAMLTHFIFSSINSIHAISNSSNNW